MVKINKTALTLFFAAMLALVTFTGILTFSAVPYKLYLLYLIFFPMAFFFINDVKLSKKDFLYFLLFSGGMIMICWAQYVYSFFDHKRVGEGTVFMAAGIIALSAGMLFFREKEEEPLKKEAFMPYEIYALAGLLAVSFAVRMWSINTLPPGVWFDEAQNGNEVIKILEGDIPGVFIPRFTQMPAMYFYIAAFFTKIFGISVFPLRFVSIILGTLSVAAFYFLLRYIFRDWKAALAGAVLFSFSRWHITFSRVAFLGMQTVFLEIIFFYFYLRMVKEKKDSFAAIAGFTLGLAQYTFSAANFMVLVVLLHGAFVMLKDFRYFAGELKNRYIILGIAALITAGPLAGYAASNTADFARRAKDVSIMKEIKEKQSISPLIKNIKAHLLMFNFEGDYNGRHNLYKKPLVANISGVLLAAGFVAAFFHPGGPIYILWFLCMLLGGVLTMTVEAPQAYRIIGILPAAYILMLMGLREITTALSKLRNSKKLVMLFSSAVIAAAVIINIHQYFVLYPAHEATYMSFSPEANKIGEVVNKNSEDYYILTSRATSMYGFYLWEQKVVTKFLNYKKGEYGLILESNMVPPEKVKSKKGVLLIIRYSDKQDIEKVEKLYPNAVKEEYIHRFHKEPMFICYYIRMRDVKEAGKEKGYILYR